MSAVVSSGASGLHAPVLKPPTRLAAGALTFVALLFVLPELALLVHAAGSSGDVWQHLVHTVLGEYLRNSLLLAAGVGAGVLLIGVPCAWLCAGFEFPARRVLEWLLLLPLAMPAYIIAYTYTGLLDFAGPVQHSLRSWFDWSAGDYRFPEIRSLAGAILLFSLVLYPYVYLLARAAFREQSACVLEVGRSLGAGPWRRFLSISLPLARPAIVAGLALALMETLADYGAVQYFGLGTFTTGIYRTWLGLGNSAAAAQLSILLLALVFVLMWLERSSRKMSRYHHASQRTAPAPRRRLGTGVGSAVALACALPVTLGFFIPAAQLGHWTWGGLHRLDAHFLKLALNSFGLAVGAALLTVGLALLFAYALRQSRSKGLRLSIRLAGMGYAIPGTVMAVGVLLPFAWFDTALDGFTRHYLGFSTGLLLSGTLVALLFAYSVRFLSVALQSIESGLARIRPSMDAAALSLGHTPAGTLRRVHLPLLKGSVLTALLLVFVDGMKELPATLILRPFDFNTLAVRAFELASDERLADAAAPALLIVLTGVLPVLLLNRSLRHAQDGLVHAS